jgi:putative phosphoribosyl transferase
MGEERVSFRDRCDAGRQLASRLGRYRRWPRTIVLGLPRGGVVPAAEIARALDLPLDVLIARKLGAPGNPEFAIGAVAEDGAPYLNDEAIALSHASVDYLTAEVARQRAEISQRRQLFRGGRALALPDDATVILVDDGVATGATLIAGIRALRELHVGHLVVALPVAPPETADVLRGVVDRLIVISTPRRFEAVGAFYDDFRQVPADEVRRLLADAAVQCRALPSRSSARANGDTEPESIQPSCMAARVTSGRR